MKTVFNVLRNPAESGVSVRIFMSGDGTGASQRKVAIHYVKKGIDLYNGKSYAAAEDLFRKAVEEDPAYARAHCYLGNALHKQGFPEEAIFEWKKAVNAEPNSDAALKAQDKLDKVANKNAKLVRQLEERLGFREERNT